MRAAHQIEQCRGQSAPVVGARPATRAARLDELGNAADARRDDRQSRRHGLEHAVRPRFGARRQHEQIARGEQRRDVARARRGTARAPRKPRAVDLPLAATARSGPSPTMQNSLSGGARRASTAARISVSWPFSGRRLATVTTRRIGRVGAVGRRISASQSTPLGITRILCGGHAFAPELRGGRGRVRDDGVRGAVRQPLRGELAAASCPASRARGGCRCGTGRQPEPLPGRPKMFA